MRPADTSDLWWRSAVVYCLDVETFADSDGDGVGDFEGLAGRIDYLAELGVTCLWLLPFHPSPNRDDGYDITDHYGVDPRLGSPGDVVEFLRVAHDRGIRVIMDLVVNHTSDEHPWFRAARRSRSSPFRHHYLWSAERPAEDRAPVFPGEEEGAWELDRATGEHYLHTFYRHQPDLDLGNPVVREEIARIVSYWLQLGFDGFRVDAVPFLISPPGAADDEDPHAYLRELHRFVNRRRAGAVLLGEVGLGHAEQLAYFGERGTELDLQFDFDTMEAVFLALVEGEAAPLERALASRPRIDASTGWATFLRSHDELTLEHLRRRQRESVFEALAPDPRRRVYDRGIARRLAPMLGGDERRVRLAHSILFALPGSPVLLYGEELGMGESDDERGRMAVRSPMQWSDRPGAGFSDAPAPALARRIPRGRYGPARVNAAAQRIDPGSLLSFVRTLARRYRATPEIAWGRRRVLPDAAPGVFAHAAEGDERVFLAVHNLRDAPATAEIDARPLPATGSFADERRFDAEPIPRGDRLRIELEPYQSRWFLADRERPSATRRPPLAAA